MYTWTRALALLLLSTSAAMAQREASRTVLSGLMDAVALDISPAGELFVLESGRSRILRVNPDGLRLDSLGNRGSGSYQFDRPTGLEVTNGMKLYVADPTNRRVQTYDRRFQYLGSLLHGHDQNAPFEPQKVRVNSRGEVIVWTPLDRKLLRYGNQGRIDLEIGPLQRFNIAQVSDYLVTNGSLFVLDGSAGMMHRFSAEGEYQQFFSGYLNAVGMASMGDLIFVLTPDALLVCNARGMVESKIPVPARPYLALGLWGGEAYLLTASNLYALRLP